MGYKAIIAGASGLVGGELVKILQAAPEYDEVILLVRRRLSLAGSKLSQIIIDFNRLPDYQEVINGHAIFSCLGSTLKKTPDLNQYREVDHDYPLALASIAANNEVSQFHLVSAIGANASSSNFYTRLKGETENAIKQIPVKSISIYQPSFLTGDRKEKRPLEKLVAGLMLLINPLLFRSLKKYRSIPAKIVGNAMYKQSLLDTSGIFTYPSDKIKELV